MVGYLPEDASALSVPRTPVKAMTSATPMSGLDRLCERLGVPSPTTGTDSAGSAAHELANIELQHLDPQVAQQLRALEDMVADTAKLSELAKWAGGKPASAGPEESGARPSNVEYRQSEVADLTVAEEYHQVEPTRGKP